MSHLPSNPSPSFVARNPHIYGKVPEVADWAKPAQAAQKRLRQSTKTLNQTEQRYKDRMIAKGIQNIREQSITLKLDPPFKSYRADLSYCKMGILHLIEVKGNHRFRRAGIAKVALAAKTYPEFAFTLAEWDGKEWKETLL